MSDQGENIKALRVTVLIREGVTDIGVSTPHNSNQVYIENSGELINNYCVDCGRSKCTLTRTTYNQGVISVVISSCKHMFGKSILLVIEGKR
jgi:hypothetical protein